MSESAQHQQLVHLIITETISIVGKEQSCFICSDAVDGFPLPPIMEEGFRPDVFYQYENLLVIGEAKTSADICRVHSRQQYESYIRKCSLFSGTAFFLIAVPWMDHATIHNIVSRICRQYPSQFIIRILDGIGGAI